MEAAKEPCSDVLRNSRRFILGTYKNNKSEKNESLETTKNLHTIPILKCQRSVPGECPAF